MKHVLFGIFAHPDDEAFGPSGTLYKFTQSGGDLHLILVTDGDAGQNHDRHGNLGAIRLQEWQASTKLLKSTSATALHYPDGSLCNNLYLEIADNILRHILASLQAYSEPIELDLLTFDPSGLSGHLDHVAVSLISTFVYHKLQAEPPRNVTIGKLKYYCLPSSTLPHADISWIYMPAGRSLEDIDEIVDVSDVYEHKLAIMRTHHSQRADMDKILQHFSDNLRREHFWYG